MPHYDVLVIGSGQAATPLVFALAKDGKQVALAERRYLGGSCVNFGCTPTKAVLASARVAHLARRGTEFGVTIPTVTIDFPAVLAGARKVVMESRDGLDEDINGSENPKLLRGHARLNGKNDEGFLVQIENGPLVTAREVVLDTGTRALIPPLDGLEGTPFFTADNWLDHDSLPQHLILLGGGYIGLEMSQFYRRMGSQVTVIDRGDRIAPREDDDVCQVLQPILENEGITFHLSSTVTKVAKTTEGGVTVTVQSEDGAETLVTGSHLFVAVGRKPNTDDLGLETVGITPDENGFLEVDRHSRTSVNGLWAVGDIRGGPMFTHTSWDDHKIVLSAMTGDGSHTTERVVPYAVFVDPQLGRVGVTEEEARKSGKPIKVGRYEMLHNGRAREYRERAGFAKVIVDAETDKLLGATIVGDEAAELIHVYVALMNADAPVRTLRDSVYVHPTLMEAVQSAAEAAA
ncbi:MAG: mercuric reductase [Cytophagales bacterium]|nr:mercuric reductase [Armatimonadota bacterium]